MKMGNKNLREKEVKQMTKEKTFLSLIRDRSGDLIIAIEPDEPNKTDEGDCFFPSKKLVGQINESLIAHGFDSVAKKIHKTLEAALAVDKELSEDPELN